MLVLLWHFFGIYSPIRIWKDRFDGKGEKGMQFVQYNEQKKRGTLDFPIDIYHVTQRHPQYVMAFHWHVEYEIIRVLSGSLKVTLDNRELTARAGDLVFIPGGTLHAGEPEDCVYDCVVFDLRMLLRRDDACAAYIQHLLDRELVILDIPPQDSALSAAAELLFSAMGSREAGWQLLVRGSLYTLFGTAVNRGYLAQGSIRDGKNYRRVSQLKKVLSLIEERYASPLTLGDLSREAGMSPKYFCRFFQEMTHQTPIEYLNACRIEHACCLLLTTDRSVTEVAFACGFNDLSYFIKTFKKKKGVTPKKYLQAPAGQRDAG